ncbi:MAG: DUF4956 domain-containing protein [Mariniphaga sp.]|nr:DUF4956 domain-containing protein [Mariniphaga sp.]
MLLNLFADVDLVLFTEFFLRLVINLITIYILTRYIFITNNYQQEYIFSLPLLGLIIFLIASILDQVNLNFTVALGLFAVFSILRYRTIPIEIKEITYLFTVIGISIINAMVEFNFSNWLGLLISNFFILACVFISENYKPQKTRNKKLLTFTPTDFEILNDKRVLLNEIKETTKINVSKVEVSKINVARNELSVWIYFTN